MDKVALLEAALGRERQARAEAERLLESKTREVYLANQEILKQNESLQAHQRQLIQSEKMASIGLLSAGVAHEINNPVGYAFSNMQLLQDNLPLFEAITCENNLRLKLLLDDLPDLVNETIEGLQRVRVIVDDMRGFSRKSGEHFEAADLREAIQRSLNLLSNKTKYQCEVQLNLQDIPKVECNIEKIGQVMLNLIFNAAQAIKQQGTITIGTCRMGDRVAITIEDNGEGIQDDHLNDVFSPFFTTKSAGEGTGLGLFICYSIVQEHGGEILLASEPGKGTRVDVILPISQECRQQDAESDDHGSTAMSHRHIAYAS